MTRRWRRVVLALTLLLIFAAIMAPHFTLAAQVEGGGKRFIQVEGGRYYTAALRNDGSVWIWGRNLWGELGLQETVNLRRIEAPVRVGRLSDIRSLSVYGSGHNLVVKSDGTVWQWGAADGYADQQVHSLLPRQVDGVSSAATAAAGEDFGVALLEDGTVWSWGRYRNEALAQDARKPAPVPGLSNVVQVAADGRNAYAVKSDGSLWKWREPSAPSNTDGAVSLHPVKIMGFSKIKQVSANNDQLYALDSKGKLWTLSGSGKAKSYHSELTIQSVRAGDGYVLLLTAQGDVFSFGSTVTGKQGKVAGLLGVTAIGAGSHHNLAITKDGRVWGWGGDKYYETGGPPTSEGGMAYRPAPARQAVDIMINGQRFDSIFPAIVTDFGVLVPAKPLSQALGAEFSMLRDEDGSGSYQIGSNGRTVTFMMNQSLFQTGTKQAALPEPVTAVTGAVMVPYQLLEKGLGVKMTWNPQAGVLTVDRAEG
ncbi:stalk domain-containing protein [Paenibacillus terreus]|uniref:Stalk domain-containing protein n=1 Tax=Paenibacillus terreus TaxID=1387834 RepID=A0ABV5BET0_9BACL